MVTPTQHKDALARAQIFRLEDLELNRSGRLSERQKKILSLRWAGWLGLTALYTILIFPLIALLVAAQTNFLLGLAAIAFLLNLISSSLEAASPFQEDLRTDNVKSVTGPLHKDYGVTSGPSRYSRIAHCNLRVNDQTFLISPATYERVRNGASYRIYYVENTRTIVNIEPL